MMIQFVSLVETKTTVDIPSGEGSDGGNRLQTVHEHEAERLGLHEGEGTWYPPSAGLGRP